MEVHSMINEKNYFEQHKDEIFAICKEERITTDGKPYHLELANAITAYLIKNDISMGRVEKEGDGTSFDKQRSAFYAEYNGAKK